MKRSALARIFYTRFACLSNGGKLAPEPVHGRCLGSQPLDPLVVGCEFEVPSQPVAEQLRVAPLPVRRFAGVPLEEVEADFADVHDRLYTAVEAMEEDELFGAHSYPFTGNTTLAAYVTSASAAHYRSTTKLIRK